MSNVKVRTHYGEDFHAGTTWEVRTNDKALIVKSALTGAQVAHYPEGCWISVTGEEDAPKPASEPIKVGDKVKSRTGKGAAPATVVHIHDDLAWISYGPGRNGVVGVGYVLKVEG